MAELKPGCTCRPTNQNNFAPSKADTSLQTGEGGYGGERIRPSLVYSLQTNLANVFRNEAPSFVLNWTSSANRADPRAQRTPPKKADKRARQKATLRPKVSM